jgi:ABC-2 type transport system permease protein
MSLWIHDARLLLRSRIALVASLLLGLFASAAVLAGLHEVSRQQAAIEAVPAAQAQDIAAVAARVLESQDAGSAAYYSFHPTWDAPSALAFAALGMRDVSPYMLRIRALGLEAQIYDGETFNPELALPGRFDFAFVLVFLAPLFVIALFHDLTSSEREAGRLRSLEALPHGGGELWLRRSALRFVVLWLVLGVPFGVGALISGAPVAGVAAFLAIAAGYLLFWIAITLLISRLRWSSVANAAALAATWLVLALVLPTLADVVINRAIPVEQGSEIALAQREAVNGAWDIPREETMRRFYAGHPEWDEIAPLPETFHYKWYFAFHQVGDESVADQVSAYRKGLEHRDASARALGWLLPTVGVQGVLTRLAETDLKAQLAYQDDIRDYHRRLRVFYYDYLFNHRPFAPQDFERAPTFRRGR